LPPSYGARWFLSPPRIFLLERWTRNREGSLGGRLRTVLCAIWADSFFVIPGILLFAMFSVGGRTTALIFTVLTMLAGGLLTHSSLPRFPGRSEGTRWWIGVGFILTVWILSELTFFAWLKSRGILLTPYQMAMIGWALFFLLLVPLVEHLRASLGVSSTQAGEGSK
jgi:hypothetical protein